MHIFIFSSKMKAKYILYMAKYSTYLCYINYSNLCKKYLMLYCSWYIRLCFRNNLVKNRHICTRPSTAFNLIKRNTSLHSHCPAFPMAPWKRNCGLALTSWSSFSCYMMSLRTSWKSAWDSQWRPQLWVRGPQASQRLKERLKILLLFFFSFWKALTGYVPFWYVLTHICTYLV